MKRPFTTITLAALSLLASAPAGAAILYSFSAPNGAYNHFHSVETNGSVASLFAIGDGSLSFNGGLAYRATDSTFFAIGNDFGSNSSLVSFTSAGAGTFTPLASLGTGFLGGLAFNSADQRFYALSSDSNGNSLLYSFADDGVLSAPRPVGAGFYGSLTYNGVDGLLYATGPGAGGIQRGLYSIDPAGAGPANLIFSLGDGFTDFGAGLAWDAGNSQFYTLGFDGFNPFWLSTFSLTGSNTLAPVASLPPVFFRGLALLPDGDGGGDGDGDGGGTNPIPEPSTYAMLGAGLAALAVLRRNGAFRSGSRAPLALIAAALFLPAAAEAQFSQPVRDVENPAQNAYVIRGNFSQDSGNVQNALGFAAAPPTYKRLTIESLGLRCEVENTATTVHAVVTLRMRNSPAEATTAASIPILMVRQGQVALNSTRNYWVGTLNGRAFHDNTGGLDGPTFNVFRVPSGEPFSCTYVIMGGLTNLPQ